MFTKIMVPVDLKHADRLGKALEVAAGWAKQYSADVHLVGVTMSSPTDVARSPGEYAQKLAGFAADRAAALGVAFTPHTEVSHDIAVDLDDVLSKAAGAIAADLIVMASHVPGLADHVFASNAGYLASHASMSVMVVR